MDISFLPHGALVHIPMALAVLFPMMYMGLLIGEARAWVSRPSWLALCFLAVIQLVSSGLAYWSGASAKILSAAQPEHIEKHETYAQFFILIWVLITLVMILDQWLRTRPVPSKNHRLTTSLLRGVSVLLIVIQSIVAIPLGKVGGALVKESSHRHLIDSNFAVQK